MKSLVQPAIDAVESGAVTYHPKRWKKLYMDWMNNIQDWCISRQTWWGHAIPAWYDHRQPGEPIVSVDQPVAKQGETYVRDPDVLDTWFSSALWPFATIGWPNDTKDMTSFSRIISWLPDMTSLRFGCLV